MTITLHHATHPERLNSIRQHGLQCDAMSTAYGEPTIHDGIYLYHSNNVDVYHDLKEYFGQTPAVIEISVSLCVLLADEDYFLYECGYTHAPPAHAPVYWYNACNSLNEHGTAVYPFDIPVQDIKIIR